MSDPYSDVKLIDDKGLRLDGRKPDELRPITIEAGVIKRADGSCYLQWGNNKVLVGVYGPREVHPRHMQNPLKGIVQARYNMVSFSVGERKRPGPDRRSTEISKLISEALERVVLTDRFPRTTVDVYIEVVEASAGTRCAGLTAASVALADAGIPMKDLVPSVASGKIGGQVVLDLGKKEDNFGEADVPFAMVPQTGEVVLLQMDGHLTRDEFETILEMNRKASLQIYEVQKEALVNRYSSYTQEEGEEEPKGPKVACYVPEGVEYDHKPWVEVEDMMPTIVPTKVEAPPKKEAKKPKKEADEAPIPEPDEQLIEAAVEEAVAEKPPKDEDKPKKGGEE
jgi:exosome complex component RRP41